MPGKIRHTALRIGWQLLARIVPGVMENARLREWVWRRLSQPGELAFHQQNEWRATPAFMEETIQIMEGFGFQRSDFAHELIVDMGAGSKLRSRFFTKAKIVAIEPLADEFKSIHFCDYDQAHAVHAEPAEARLPQYDEQIRFLMCMNVLDHVFDYEAVLRNMWTMLGPGGVLLLSVDLHDAAEADPMHPVNLDKPTLRAAVENMGFKIQREYDGMPDGNRKSYGHGTAYTIVAEKPQ
jgi:SAM-dependent methyltransferase